MASIQEMVKCAARELQMRESVYPKRVESGKMTAAFAQYEINAMRAILENLKAQTPAEPEQMNLLGGTQ